MINTYLKKSSSFYIFGAGSTAKKIKNILIKEGKNVIAFIVTDSIPGKFYDDIEIISIDRPLDFNIPVVIGVFNREPNAFLSEIILALKNIGFQKVITYPEFYSIFENGFHYNFWLTNRTFYSQNIKFYNQVLNFLEDQKSIENYKIIINYLKTFDASILLKPDFENQYFPPDINIWDGKDAFLDLGSYDGSNIVDAYRNKGVLDLVVAFEPVLENFNKMVNNQLLKGISHSMFLYPCGVWSKTMHLKFNTESGESSAVNISGNEILPVVKIDDVVHAKPGYIKFDVEGAEIEALLGCKNTISLHKPSLAISIYHQPDHFYSIPILINSWNLGYKMFVRFHGNNLFDTVLYCIQ